MRLIDLLRAVLCLSGLALLAGIPISDTVLAAEPASKVEVEYDIFVAGLSVGTGRIELDFSGNAYASSVHAEASGFASLFFQMRILAEGTGILRGRRVLANRYHLDIRDSHAFQTVEMGMNEGDVETLMLDPPIVPRADRVPVLAEHKRNIIDPVGGVIVPRRTRQVFDPENCNQTTPVFDGAGRFDLIMQAGRAGKVTVEGYPGQVIVCSIRYKAISGQKRKQSEEKKTENEGRIEVKLAPIAGRPFYIPLEVNVPIGPGLLKLVARSASGLANDLPAIGDLPPEE